MKIAILGYGVEGKALTEYFQKKKATITVCDENADLKVRKKVKTQLGKDAFKKVKEYDQVFRSPGIPVSKVGKTKKLTSLTEYFFDHCPCPIIGVTGTKGKGTTSTLIYEILKEAGYDAYLGGNIGVPPITFLDKLTQNSVVVLELSSFQLQTLHKSPHVAVVLNVTSEHMDYHKDLKEYRDSKAQLVANQTEGNFVIVNADYKPSVEIGKRSKGVTFSVSTRKDVRRGAQVRGKDLVLKNNGDILKVMPIKDIGLIGDHNLENALPAIVATSLFDVSIGSIKKAIKSFKGLPHRLEKVCTRKGVEYYNDSFSSIPETSIAAIRSFGRKPIHLIGGGSEKFSDFKNWAKACIEQKNLKTILLTGEQSASRMAIELEKAIKKHKRNLKVIHVDTLADAINEIKTLAKSGSVALLSPACASFEEFPNYKVRGKTFKTLARK